jgi:hypothetical protein
MSLKRISQLPGFNGVAAGQTATLDLPVGPRYHVVWLQCANTAEASVTSIIDEIRVKINGKTQRVMSATELNALNSMFCSPSATLGTVATSEYAWYEHTAATPDNNLIPIFFAEPWRPEIISKEGLAWGTGDVATFQIEVDLNATNTGVVLSAFAEVDNAVVTTEGLQRAMPMGPIVKWSRFNIPFSSTGWLDVQTLPRRDVILQISIWHTANYYVSEYELLADNYQWRKLTDLQNAAVLKSRGMTPTVLGAGATYRTDIVLDYDDFPPGAGLRADGIQDLRLRLNVAGSSTVAPFTTIMHTLGRPD